jgi:hypothetical protein
MAYSTGTQHVRRLCRAATGVCSLQRRARPPLAAVASASPAGSVDAQPTGASGAASDKRPNREFVNVVPRKFTGKLGSVGCQGEAHRTAFASTACAGPRHSVTPRRCKSAPLATEALTGRLIAQTFSARISHHWRPPALTVTQPDLIAAYAMALPRQCQCRQGPVACRLSSSHQPNAMAVSLPVSTGMIITTTTTRAIKMMKTTATIRSKTSTMKRTAVP